MNNELTTRDNLIALDNAITTWATSTTDPGSLRRHDLERDKQRVLVDFVSYVKKHPVDVSPSDVLAWRLDLEGRGLAESTVYAMLSKISSFYRWAMSSPMTRELFQVNPVDLARPKPPKPYATSKALTPSQQRALMEVVKFRADCGNVVAKRDYALLLFYFETGMRRQEIISLRWGDTNQEDTDTITTRVKGGNKVTKEVADQRCWRALFDYLEFSGRLATIKGIDPLWARHDKGADGLHDPLSARGFVKNLKRYAEEADIEMHLHQTRHTHAQKVREEGGIGAAQESLGHKDQGTTEIYTSNVSVVRDRHGPSVLDALGIE